LARILSKIKPKINFEKENKKVKLKKTMFNKKL
jgi:hypothetical protein